MAEVRWRYAKVLRHFAGVGYILALRVYIRHYIRYSIVVRRSLFVKKRGHRLVVEALDYLQQLIYVQASAIILLKRLAVRAAAYFKLSQRKVVRAYYIVAQRLLIYRMFA